MLLCQSFEVVFFSLTACFTDTSCQTTIEPSEQPDDEAQKSTQQQQLLQELFAIDGNKSKKGPPTLLTQLKKFILNFFYFKAEINAYHDV